MCPTSAYGNAPHPNMEAQRGRVIFFVCTYMVSENDMENFRKTIKYKGKTYVIKASHIKNKKYTAWLAGPKEPHPEIKGDFIQVLSQPVHFGDFRHNHYKDRLGLYKDLDTNDKKQRELYKKRFAKLIEAKRHDPTSPMFWGYRLLW